MTENKQVSETSGETSSSGVPAKRPTENWHPLTSLRDQVDRLFEDFGRGFPAFPSFGRSLFDAESAPAWQSAFTGRTPAVDVVEKDDRFEITAEMPGLTDEDIDVTLSDDVLTIKGEKKEEREEEKDAYRVSERRSGSFQRSFRLPKHVDPDKIEAHVADGVLSISVPKSADAPDKVRKIAIGKK